MAEPILSVAELNTLVRGRLESDPMLLRLAVRGEVSGYKAYPSGYHYFSLKDKSCVVSCVISRVSARRLRFLPRNGVSVVLMGNVTLYEPQGKYQFNVTDVLPAGEGALEAEFKRLLAKLEAEGIFDEVHKKPLPRFPRRVAVVTSESGAVIHDIIRTMRNFWPAAEIVLLPAAVQGENAPGELVRAIALANRWKAADVMIVGRGGGSREDLWAFNDESVARAIYASEIPVVSAVGHEPDVTIADYAADRRAPTPTGAAELVVPKQAELRAELAGYDRRMRRAMERRLDTLSRRLDELASRRALTDPGYTLEARRRDLALWTDRFRGALERGNVVRRREYAALAAKLDALSPLKVLARGYSIAEKDGVPLRGAAGVRVGDRIDVKLAGGSLGCTVEEIERNGGDEL